MDRHQSTMTPQAATNSATGAPVRYFQFSKNRERKEESCWEIGWIAADPDHWGLGLGGCVLANALRFTRKLEKRHVYLLTDDFRTPAIKTYLKLGFVPDLSHPSYEDRWLKVLAALGSSYEKYTSLVKRE